MPRRKQGVRPWLALVAAALLTACAAPVLLMPSSGQLMWALLKPLVGFDPNAVNLFEQPIVKQRMTALLGERYTPVLTLLRTANELRQEGPLFFLVSRYTPIPEIAEGAGLVWNADTNQLAAVLRQGNVAEVFAEKVQRAVIEDAQAAVQEAVVTAPVWPAALKPWVEAATVIGGGALQESLRMPAPAADQDGGSGS
ncbi:MAG: hypothetical protein AB7O21_02980 [Gammaproteobacteria bacterium]